MYLHIFQCICMYFHVCNYFHVSPYILMYFDVFPCISMYLHAFLCVFFTFRYISMHLYKDFHGFLNILEQNPGFPWQQGFALPSASPHLNFMRSFTPQTPLRNLGLAGTGTGHGPCPCKPYVPYRILGVFYLEGVIFIRVFCWLGGLAVLD